jgi:hypothetical protein
MTKDLRSIGHVAQVLLVMLIISWIIFRYLKSIKKTNDQS